MEKENRVIKEIDLAGTVNGKITVAHIEKPYGAVSEAVLSIGVSLDGEEAKWKAHIPYANLDQLMLALNEAKALKE